MPDYETEKGMTFDCHMICFPLKESPCLILLHVRTTAVYYRTCFLDTYKWKQTPRLVHSWVRISLCSKNRPEPSTEVELLSGLCLNSGLPPTALWNVSFHSAHRLSSLPTATAVTVELTLKKIVTIVITGQELQTLPPWFFLLNSSKEKKKSHEWIHKAKAASDCQPPRKSRKYSLQQSWGQCVVTPLKGQSLGILMILFLKKNRLGSTFIVRPTS